MKPKQLLPANQPLQGKRLKLERLSAAHVDYLLETHKNEGFWQSYRHHEDRSISREVLVERLDFESQKTPQAVGKMEWVVCELSGPEPRPIGFAALTAWNQSQLRAEYLIGIVDKADITNGLGLETSLLVFDFAFNHSGLNKLVSPE